MILLFRSSSIFDQIFWSSSIFIQKVSIFIHIHPECCSIVIHIHSENFFSHPHSSRFFPSLSIFIRFFFDLYPYSSRKILSSSIFIQNFSIFVHIHQESFYLHPFSSRGFLSSSMFTQKNSIFGHLYLEKNYRKTQDLSPWPSPMDAKVIPLAAAAAKAATARAVAKEAPVESWKPSCDMHFSLFF
jgi:hypothetical protein